VDDRLGESKLRIASIKESKSDCVKKKNENQISILSNFSHIFSPFLNLINHKKSIKIFRQNYLFYFVTL
jgi:hypothetical protein